MNRLKVIVISIILLYSSIQLLESNATEKIYGDTIHFYNPEININKFAYLKTEIDSYLSNFDNFRFQPFSNMQVFENYILNKKKGVLFISSWHYNLLQKKVSLIPFLVGMINGKPTHKKILISKKGIDDLLRLKNVTIASSGNYEYTNSTLKTMLSKNNPALLKTQKILVVPKDIDALMAVGFGMANAALTSENSLQDLASINPNMHKSLNTICVSDNFLLPVIATFQGYTKNDEKLIEVIENMAFSEIGIKDLKMLGLEGWKKITNIEKGLLNKNKIK